MQWVRSVPTHSTCLYAPHTLCACRISRCMCVRVFLYVQEALSASSEPLLSPSAFAQLLSGEIDLGTLLGCVSHVIRSHVLCAVCVCAEISM
jgi:hypothetical protein